MKKTIISTFDKLNKNTHWEKKYVTIIIDGYAILPLEV